MRDSDAIHHDTLSVLGRDFAIPVHCNGFVKFDFENLCGDEIPRGSADYLELSRRFHTVFVENVPTFNHARRHMARRLIWLVDALYESKCMLVMSAEQDIDSLFLDADDSSSAEQFADNDIMLQESLGSMSERRERAIDGDKDKINEFVFTGADDIFAFKRCRSRIHEMQSAKYQYLHHISNANRISDGYCLNMPAPPTPLDIGEDEDELKENCEPRVDQWQGETMAPPLDLTVGDIRTKTEDLFRKNAELKVQNSAYGKIRTAFTSFGNLFR